MASRLQLRRGTKTEHESFAGQVGETTVDTTNDDLRVHDGSTVGGKSAAQGNKYNGIKQLDNAPLKDRAQYDVAGFYAGTEVGGGPFIYDASRPKADHNGGTVITPEAIAAWDGTQGGLSVLLDWTGTGTGAFVRANTQIGYVSDFGGYALSDLTKVINIALNALDETILDISGQVDDNGITMPANSTLTFIGDAVLTKTPTAKGTYAVIKITDTENVTVNNPKIIGDLDGHLGTEGEFGHGISMRGSSNVTINRPKIYKCWGDGIYIGIGVVGAPPNRNVKITGAYIDDCRRQGVSVISVDGLEIDGIAKNIGVTNGTAPMFGIDFEPNNAGEILKGIKVKSFYTENCRGGGITFVPNFLDETSEEVDITINGFSDKGSLNGIYLAYGGGASNPNIKGRVVFNSPTLINNERQAIRSQRYGSNGPRVDIIKPHIINPNTSGNASVVTGAAIQMGNDTEAYDIGNVHIHNPSIEDDRAVPLTSSTVHFFNGALSKGCVNVSFIDPTKLEGMPDRSIYWYNSEGIISDAFRQITYSAPGSYTENSAYYYGITDNVGLSASINITLHAGKPDGMEIEFVSKINNSITIYPDATQRIWPDGNGDGKYVRITGVGSRVKLRKEGNDLFVIDSQGTVVYEP